MYICAIVWLSEVIYIYIYIYIYVYNISIYSQSTLSYCILYFHWVQFIIFYFILLHHIYIFIQSILYTYHVCEYCYIHFHVCYNSTNQLYITPSNGYLGSRTDEERSELRDVMRIADVRESSNLWTQLALSGLPREHVPLSLGSHPLAIHCMWC